MMATGQLDSATLTWAGTLFPSALGWMTLLWNDVENPRFAEMLTFDLADETMALRNLHHAECADILREEELPRSVRAWSKLLQQYAAGKWVDLNTIPVDLSRFTKFQRQVIIACRGIERGQTLSYGELAEQAGSPHAGRAVGNVMRSNRLPLLIPCHRVVGAAGSLGGYSASSGLAMKRRLLRLEGVEV